MRAEDRAALKADFLRNQGFGNSPLYDELWSLVAGREDLIDFYDEVELPKQRAVLLMAAVRYLVLDGAEGELARIYEAPDTRDSIERVQAAFYDFAMEHEDDVRRLMRNRFVQTNEPNRCAALLPALMEVSRKAHRSLGIVELGASAGLNLLFDRYRYDYGNGPVLGSPGSQVRINCELRKSVPLLDDSFPMVDYRVGIDPEPIRFGDESDERWLRACVWVGDVAAEQRLTAALELAHREWPEVEEGDPADSLERTVEDVPEEVELCIVSSYVMQWMSDSERQELLEAVREIGQERSTWWVTFERPGIVPDVAGLDDSSADVLALRHITADREEVRPLAGAHPLCEWMHWVDAETTAW